jgi:hypothetical protein
MMSFTYRRVMMKGLFRLIFVCLLLAGTAIGSAFAFDARAYPDSLEKGNIVINAGIGFGTPLYGDMSIPPISASIDYALPLGGLPFTLGGIVGFNQSKYEWSILNYGYTYTYTGIAFGARMGYHPDFGVKNLDAYADITLGYYIYTGKAEYDNWPTGTPKAEPSSYSTFLFGGSIGARYFFIPKVGAFLELGYSALSYVTAGVAIKF